MTWNHRVVKRVSPLGEPYLALHEVFYENGDLNKPEGRDSDPQGFVCDFDEGLQGIISRLEQALESIRQYPILDDPWPDEILPHMIERFPEDDSLAVELDRLSDDAELPSVWLLDGHRLGLGSGTVFVTTIMEGVEPRIKYAFSKDFDDASMSVTFDPEVKLKANSLAAFFRHVTAPKLVDWASKNRHNLMFLWTYGRTMTDDEALAMIEGMYPS